MKVEKNKKKGQRRLEVAEEWMNPLTPLKAFHIIFVSD